MVLLAYYWSSLYHIAIPEEEFAGINWKQLYLLTPFACVLGEVTQNFGFGLHLDGILMCDFVENQVFGLLETLVINEAV